MDVVSAEDEALVGQGEAALLAVEAVLVPGEALVVHHVGAVAEPCTARHDGTKTETEIGTGAGISVTHQHTHQCNNLYIVHS